MSTHSNIYITPVQIRMARAALQMTVRDLAELTGIAANTVSRVETGQTKARATTMDAMARVFRERGLLFVGADDLAGPGVRLANSSGGDK